ncbi:MAG TPA: S9 family peptidase [Thermomicrobiales bacterium]
MADRTPLTIEEIVTLALPGDAQISPDGRSVAYVLADMAKDGAVRHAHLWLVPMDGSMPPRELTASPRQDTTPRWSPDGRTLAFLSDRNEENKQDIYLLPVSGGEAQRLGDLHGGLAELSWSPEGATLAVIVTDPETDDEKKRKENKDDAYVVESRQHRKYAHLWLVDVATGTATQCGPDDLHVWTGNGYAWSPDGARIAIVGSAKPGWAHGFGGTALHLLSVADGTAHEIAGAYGTPSSPRWSPDGTTLAFIARPERAAQGAGVLMLCDLDSGRIESRLADVEQGKNDVCWLDNRTLLLTILDGTAHMLHRYVVPDDEMSTPLGHFPTRGAFPGNASILMTVDAAGENVAVVHGDMAHPFEIWAGPLSGSMRQISDHNGWMGDRSIAPSRVIHWAAADGRQIAGVLVTPDPALHGDGPYPLIVQVHGGPAGVYVEDLQLTWSRWGQLLAANGYAVILPNPRGSSGRGDPFQTLNYADWGGNDMDDILRGVDAVIAEGIGDAERTGIGGWSYGGFMTAWTESQTARFKAAIVGAGLCNLVSFYGTTDIRDWHESHFGAPLSEDAGRYWDHSAMKYLAQVTTPTLILHGEKDERVPFAQGQEWFAALTRRGLPVEFVAFPREPHAIEERAHQRTLLNRVVAWYDQWVKGT